MLRLPIESTNNSLEAATITALSDDRFGTLTGDADCQVGTVLASGAFCEFSAIFAIPAGDFPGNHVNVFTGTVTDGDGNNDSATDNETIAYTDVLPDITVLKTGTPTSVRRPVAMLRLPIESPTTVWKRPRSPHSVMIGLAP